GLLRHDLRLAAYALDTAARRADRQGDTTHPLGAMLRDIASSIRRYSISMASLQEPLPAALRDRLLLTIAVLDTRCASQVTRRLVELGSAFDKDGQPLPEYLGKPRTGPRSALT